MDNSNSRFSASYRRKVRRHHAIRNGIYSATEATAKHGPELVTVWIGMTALLFGLPFVVAILH